MIFLVEEDILLSTLHRNKIYLAGVPYSYSTYIKAYNDFFNQNDKVPESVELIVFECGNATLNEEDKIIDFNAIYNKE